MAKDSRKEMQRLVAAAVEQGWTATNKRRGVLVKSPDGQHAYLVHLTPQDHRAPKNMRAWFRRRGVEC